MAIRIKGEAPYAHTDCEIVIVFWPSALNLVEFVGVISLTRVNMYGVNFNIACV